MRRNCRHFSLFSSPLSSQQDQTSQDRMNSTTEILASMMKDSFDAWPDADMDTVIQYLRANKHLNVPDEIRQILGMNK